MDVRLSRGESGELYLHVDDGWSNEPAVDVHVDQLEVLAALARLDQCECNTAWDSGRLRSVTLRLSDPRIDVLAGAIHQLYAVARNVGAV